MISKTSERIASYLRMANKPVDERTLFILRFTKQNINLALLEGVIVARYDGRYELSWQYV